MRQLFNHDFLCIARCRKGERIWQEGYTSLPALETNRILRRTSDRLACNHIFSGDWLSTNFYPSETRPNFLKFDGGRKCKRTLSQHHDKKIIFTIEAYAIHIKSGDELLLLLPMTSFLRRKRRKSLSLYVYSQLIIMIILNILFSAIILQIFERRRAIRTHSSGWIAVCKQVCCHPLLN